MTRSEIDLLTYKINGACIEVHKTIGPGLLESVYQKCLEKEFKIRNIAFQSQLNVPVLYKGEEINCNFICNFLIENQVIIEIKSVVRIVDIHRAQVLNYINLMKKPKGILINFNVKNIINEGHETFVNDIYRKLL